MLRSGNPRNFTGRANGFVALVLLAWLWPAPALCAQDQPWTLVKERNGISVYARHADDARIKTFRAVMRSRLDDEYAVIATFNDYANWPKWLYLFDHVGEVKRRGPASRILHMTTSLPWPIKNRDAVVEFRLVQRVTRDEESFSFVFSSVSGLVPESDAFVRIKDVRGLLKIRRLGNDEVEIIYEAYFDPGGYVPPWMVNIIARDIPYFTLLRASEFVQRPEMRGKYFPYAELRGSRPPDVKAPRSYIYGTPPERDLEMAFPVEGSGHE